MKRRFPDNIRNLRKDTLRRIIIVAVIIVFAGIWLFYEFSHKEDVNDAINNVNILDREVKQVELYMYPVQTLNPIVSADENMVYINKLMYSSLFDFDQYMTPVGDLAESYSFSGDTLTVNLKNASWQDGTTVDAGDVEFTVDAIKAAGEAGPYYNKGNKIESVEGNGRTVKIQFKDENDMSLSYLSFPIVAEHKYDKVSEFIKDIEGYTPFVSGMYVCKSYEAGKEMILAANDRYYGEKPESTIRVNVIKRNSSLSKLVETSNITALYDKSLMRKTSITKKDMKIQNFTGNQVEFIGFNMKNEFLKNKNVRQAIAYAIDTDNILEECYYGSGVKSDTIYYPEYLTTKEKFDYGINVEKATEILKDEDLKDRNDDGILDNEDERSFSVRILVDSTHQERTDAANSIAESLENIGIEATVEARSTSEYTKALRSGSFDIYIGGMSIDESMDFRSLLKTGGVNNYTGLSDRKLDNLLDSFMSGNTEDESAEIIGEIEKILKEDVYFYCIGYQTYGIIKAPVFNGEINATFSNPYKGIETWYCIYEQREEEDDEVETPPAENGN